LGSALISGGATTATVCVGGGNEGAGGGGVGLAATAGEGFSARGVGSDLAATTDFGGALVAGFVATSSGVGT
jgi:hypothetical protein